MLPKQHRLTGTDIAFLMRRGSRWRGEVFHALWFKPRPGKQGNRTQRKTSVQIPTKVDKHAVGRTKRKRAAYHQLVAYAPIEGASTSVLVFRYVHKGAHAVRRDAGTGPEAMKSRNEAVQRDFTKFFKQF